MDRERADGSSGEGAARGTQTGRTSCLVEETWGRAREVLEASLSPSVRRDEVSRTGLAVPNPSTLKEPRCCS